MRLLRLAVGVGLLAACAVAEVASAQDRAEIVIVPNIPHSGSVNAVALSPDGSRVLSGGSDKTIRLWQVESGQLIRTFDGHSGVVASAAFSPDGTRVVSGNYDKTLKLWNTENAKAQRSVRTMTSTFSGLQRTSSAKLP